MNGGKLMKAFTPEFPMRKITLALICLALLGVLGSCAKCSIYGDCLEEGRRAVYEINPSTMPTLEGRYAACQYYTYRQASFGINCRIVWDTGIVIGP